MHVASRSAAVGDKLVSTGFNTSTSKGFADAADKSTAVCLMPGSELAFDENIQSDKVSWAGWARTTEDHGHKVARFRQINLHNQHTHHDALELPDGTIIMLNDLIEGQKATVLQLPAAPRNEAEAEEQKRIAVSA